MRRSRCKQEGADEIFIFQTRCCGRANNLPAEIICFEGIMETVWQTVEELKQNAVLNTVTISNPKTLRLSFSYLH